MLFCSKKLTCEKLVSTIGACLRKLIDFGAALYQEAIRLRHSTSATTEKFYAHLGLTDEMAWIPDNVSEDVKQ